MAKIVPLGRHSRRLVLNKRQTLLLVNAQGTIVAVDRGCVWLTLERDPRDVVLVKGMRFEIDRPGRTIIAAETDSTLRLLVPETVRDRVVAAIGRGIARVLNGWAGRLVRRAVPYF
jgi:L-aminopeptidase/D-esterase-like protein